MSHANNRVKWCLKKAEKEMKESGNHKGLVKIKPNKAKAVEHITKAEHYLKATEYLKKGGYSDISASTIFYSIYHCMLAIAARHGYDSRNQECTFALIHSLIEDGKIDFGKTTLNKISSMNAKETGATSTKIREKYQYGTELSIKDNLYKELVDLAKEAIAKTKEVIEE